MAETFDQVNEYDPADTDPTNLMEVSDETRIGMHELTITEYNTATVPEISIGSLIEINGTLFKVNDTGGGTGMPVTVGGVADGTVYIELIPSGAAPDQILTPTFTATAPTWFDAKQGWYDAGGTNRYIHYAMTKATASYTPKWEFPLKNNLLTTFREDNVSELFDAAEVKHVIRSFALSTVDTVTFASDLTNYVATLAVALTVAVNVTMYWTTTAVEFRLVTTFALQDVSGTFYYLASS